MKVMLMVLSYDDVEDNLLRKEGVREGDILNVRHYSDDLYDPVDYTDAYGDFPTLYETQIAFPVKATRLAKKLYPDAPEKDGMLWLKKSQL